MATITIEIGKKGKKGVHPVSFLVCQAKTKKRIPTEIYLSETDLSRNGKKIKNFEKAKLLEDMRRKLEDRLFGLSLEIAAGGLDAEAIAKMLVLRDDTELDFFVFADKWIGKAKIKGVQNYCSMLHSVEAYLGRRKLPFSSLNYTFLKGFEDYLSGKPRAQSLYLGEIRHLFREAMREYNDDYTQVIKNDPFVRYRVPKQQMKKGVRALSLEELLRVYSYEGRPRSRAQLARDCFILSFCLMGMNSVDMYGCTDCRDGVIRYNRAKTKDRRSDGAYIEVRVHPFISGLMKRYRGDKCVFNFSRRYCDAAALNKHINVGLKEVGRAVGIEDLEFYQARHTFATLSRNLMKFSKSDVDEALNHVGTMDIADVYIKKDFSIINENNFKLIDRVFELG